MYKKDEQDKEDEESIGAWYSYYKGIESHVQLCNTLILTYRIDYNEYTGGAHGIYMSTFLNLDLKTLSPIRLDDLFEGDYKEALTDLLWKQLMADNNVSTRQELEDMATPPPVTWSLSRISTWTQRESPSIIMYTIPLLILWDL